VPYERTLIHVADTNSPKNVRFSEAREQAFLRSLSSATALAQTAELEAKQINRLGALLGLSAEDTARVVGELQRQSLVDIRWGGTVSLTPEGREWAEGKPGAPQVRLGDGATYIGPGAQVSGVMGQNAMGHGAVRIEAPAAGGGDLAAALQALPERQEELPTDQKEKAQALAEAAKATLEEAQKRKPDRVKLEQHLDRTTRLLDKLGGLGASARKLAPTFTLMRQGLEALGRWATGG